jgi:hypothetical protein
MAYQAAMNGRRAILALAVAVAAWLAGSSFDLRAASQAAPGRKPAASLTRPTTPAKTLDADGFIRRWLLLEPIPVKGALTDSAVRAVVDASYFPDQLTVVPRDGDTVTVGGTALRWHAVDTLRYNVNLYHFAYALEKPTSNVLVWAVTIVHSPREIQGVRLAIGSNAASIWWVNEEEVIGLYNDRQSVIDDGVSKRLTLRKGPNVVRAAVINGGGATDFCARFLDESGNPVKGLSATEKQDHAQQ